MQSEGIHTLYCGYGEKVSAHNVKKVEICELFNIFRGPTMLK